MRRVLPGLLVGGVLALVLSACGNGELKARKGLPASTRLVTKQDVRRYRAHSPQRTLMTWWRAMQYSDPRGYLGMLAGPLRSTRRDDRSYRAQLPIISRQVTNAFPHITRVETKAGTATVYAQVEFRSLAGANKYSASRVPQAFPLVREGSAWRISDDLFVEAGSDSELRKRARQQAAAVRDATANDGDRSAPSGTAASAAGPAP